MPTLINDPRLEEALIAERRDRGLDRFDEVWDGVYVMAPLANNEHQDLVGGIYFALKSVIGVAGMGRVLPGANVSDQEVDWTKNYRCPDVLVFLNANPAEDRDTHWFGGPDFAVEVVSRLDRSREKLGFYSSVGVRELLIVDRDPWQLELFRLIDGELTSVATATEANPTLIQSEVLPIHFRMIRGETRPTIEVLAEGRRSWTV